MKAPERDTLSPGERAIDSVLPPVSSQRCGTRSAPGEREGPTSVPFLQESGRGEPLKRDMPEDNLPSANHETGHSLRNEPTHSEDGVDLTLIRWMLSLTPAERLQVLQQSVQSLLRLRDAKAKR